MWGRGGSGLFHCGECCCLTPLSGPSHRALSLCACPLPLLPLSFKWFLVLNQRVILLPGDSWQRQETFRIVTTWGGGGRSRPGGAGPGCCSASYRTQGAGRRAQDAGRRMQGTGRRAQDAGRRTQGAGQDRAFPSMVSSFLASVSVQRQRIRDPRPHVPVSAPCAGRLGVFRRGSGSSVWQQQWLRSPASRPASGPTAQ